MCSRDIRINRFTVNYSCVGHVQSAWIIFLISKSLMRVCSNTVKQLVYFLTCNKGKIRIGWETDEAALQAHDSIQNLRRNAKSAPIVAETSDFSN